MAYRWKPREPIQDALRRVADEQLSKALEARGGVDGDLHEGVHEIRKRCKKVRGLLRLVRPALGETYSRENAGLRDAARLLSGLRDATALLETHGLVVERLAPEANPAWRARREQALRERRERLVETVDLEARMERAAAALAEARRRARTWTLEAEGFDAVGPGLAKTYRRAREAMGRALEDPAPERFHEWRKRAKYHRYHLALLRDLWPDIVPELRDQAHALTDLLGDDHDLAVYRATLLDEPGLRADHERDDGPDLAALTRLRRELQARAAPLGRRLFAESPKAMVRRWREYARATDEAARLPEIES